MPISPVYGKHSKEPGDVGSPPTGGRQASSEGMTLSQVANLLDVNPRRVQYLRESGLVAPSVVGTGRGNACLYSKEDVLKLYLALVELPALTPYFLEHLLGDIDTSLSQQACPVGSHSSLVLDLDAIRLCVAKLFGT